MKCTASVSAPPPMFVGYATQKFQLLASMLCAKWQIHRYHSDSLLLNDLVILTMNLWAYKAITV
jgi:hypothetical protein